MKAHVAGIATANYEAVEVQHSVARTLRAVG